MAIEWRPLELVCPYDGGQLQGAFDTEAPPPAPTVDPPLGLHDFHGASALKCENGDWYWSVKAHEEELPWVR